MKADSVGQWTIKEKCRGCFQDVFAQVLPSVRFGENAFREAFGAVAAIGLLDNLEHQFLYTPEN